ncbi:MAG: glycoside hydrolase family 3 C-terminal domain-containing protein [Bacteroidales bacterium]|nr:glycoside hydrolase family 3 C-terminal domain-containing protein [Bacteroidales bacterium]
MNPELTLKQRVDDLVLRLTLDEKILQMQHTAPAIERLGIPQYNWWNECLHGVARNGIATVFPQAIGIAATFNPPLIKQEADVISTEARAKYYEAISKGSHEIYQGLTFWSPNINIFRDPRWGRGQETYGEDPFLTSQVGKAFVQGLQGNDPDYFKVIATAKHFAVHSGPESQRHKFDAWPSQRDLYDTYLPAFEVLVKEAKVYSVMTCYNRVFGIPSSANTFLFKETLRGKWGFNGYVVSDCWAISDIYSFHNFVPTAEKAVALTLKAGTDLSCGPEYGSLKKAVELGYITENELDVSVKRLFEARFRLGLFDPSSKVIYSAIPATEYDTPAHQELAHQVALQSIVLLKNDNNILPLTSKSRTIAVIGPYANDTSVLLGNYNGIPSHPVTMLQGIRNKAGKSTKVIYCQGVNKPEVQALRSENVNFSADPLFSEAISVSMTADVIIFAGGISPNLEGEEMDVKVPGFSAGDRTTLDLPQNQQKLLEKLKLIGKPIILLLTNGSALAINWAQQNATAIVETWYPGEEGGNAVADVLFGNYNPAGRLPVTFYKSVDDIPAFEDYSMKGRTYKYFKGTPLYAFGYGLSYTSFNYEVAELKAKSLNVTDTIVVSVKISNTGKFNGDEVIQVYAKQPIALKDQPIKSLIAFQRVQFGKGEMKEVILSIPVSRLRHFNPDIKDYAIAKGEYELLIGAASDDIKFKTIVTIE